jgi:hypothetical protein
VNVAGTRSASGCPDASPSPPVRAQSFGAALRRGLAEGVPDRAQRGHRDPEVRELAPGADPRPTPVAGTLAEPERLPLASLAPVHRVALAVEVLKAGDRGRIEIGLHPGAALQLDAVGEGVAMVLTVAPPLARAAAAELPALVEGLRQRGVKVARAEVRVGAERRGSGGRAR